MADALSTLLGLSSQYTPQIGLLDQRQRRLDEMKRNRAFTTGNPHAAVGATEPDITSLETDIAEDPYTGGAIRAEQAYNAPAEVAKRNQARQDALAKLLMPEQLKGKNELALEQLRGENALSVAKEKGNQAGANVDLFTPEGRDAAVNFFGATGKMIPGLTRSPQTIGNVVNQYGAQNPGGGNIGLAAATYGANAGSLNKLQATQDAATAFINTADANGQRLIDAMEHAPGIGIPLFDKPIRAAARLMGNEQMKAIDAIRNSVNQEYSRILSSPTMGGVVTQTERDAIAKIMSDDSTTGQIGAALGQLKAEAQNRQNAYQQQNQAIQTRLGGAPQAAPQYLSGAGWDR